MNDNSRTTTYSSPITDAEQAIIDSDPELKGNWPSVTVIIPTCVARRKWQYNIYTAFLSQDYPGKLSLLVHDGPCTKKPEHKSEDDNFWLSSTILKDEFVNELFPIAVKVA